MVPNEVEGVIGVDHHQLRRTSPANSGWVYLNAMKGIHMKRFAAMSVICGFGTAASAWSMGFAATTMSSLAGLANEAETITSTETTESLAPGLCVYNLSKNGCDGFVEPGHYEMLGCPGEDCRTIRVTDSVYKTTFKSSGLACGIDCESSCDEFPDGELTLKFDYVLRADSCCPFRGSWDGEWELKLETGTVYYGTAHGTIGVGTNRESDCNLTSDACERCYDVQLQGNDWLVGVEGSFRGQETNSTSPIPDELNFTMDGTWLSKNDPDRPFGEPFRFFNRFDGAHLDYCP